MNVRLAALLRAVYVEIAEITWRTVLVILLFHFASSWGLMVLSGEEKFTHPITFLYFYATTATTIGYGDLSPGTNASRLFAVFWLYPGSIALFGTILTKVGGSLWDRWNKRMNGMADFSKVDGASVLIGYHAQRTRHMIDEIVAGDPAAQIILLARAVERCPDERIRFVRTDSLADVEAMRRASIATARHVVIYADDDEQTMAAALAASAVLRDANNESAHMVCYFADESTAKLLTSHIPRIECVVSTSVPQVVRAMQDPGSSRILAALASTIDDATIFSFVVPDGVSGVTLAVLADHLRRHHDAILIAFQDDGGVPIINASPSHEAGPGDRLYVISDRRLHADAIEWAELRSVA